MLQEQNSLSFDHVIHEPGEIVDGEVLALLVLGADPDDDDGDDGLFLERERFVRGVAVEDQ